MHSIDIGDCTIDIVRKNIKHLHLSVYPPTGRIRIATPLNVDDETVRLFAISKLVWIKRNRRNFEKQEREAPRVFKERESHYFKGQRYLLRIKEHTGAPKIELKTKTYIDFFVKPSTTIAERKKLLNDWYRNELKSEIPAIIKKWEKIIKVSVEDWGVKQMKTKWGTCNIEDKRIWLNLELAKKPTICLEYIIVHEMIHLLERHHNAHFIMYLDKFMPKWKLHKEELNKLPVSHGEWEY